ncbi:MAG TPA: serine hydrolase [Acidimicrobiales bacterium]
MAHSSRRRWLAVALALAAFGAAACSSGSDSGGDQAADSDGARADRAEAAPVPEAARGAVYPGDAWERGDAAEAGFDPARLEALAAEAEAADSNCLVVARDGRIVADWYWNGTERETVQEVFSTTKSITSTLVGIAQADGALDITDPAAEYIPEWADGPASTVTVENLLSNDSGRFWTLANDYVTLIQTADRTAFAIGLEQSHEPGEVWVYNNAAIQTLDAVLEEATGVDPAEFAEERLFAPTGMRHTAMSHDNAGNTNTFFGLQTTCEDMVRFGYLFLRRGHWDGTQVVPEEWVEAATGRPSQDINEAYGYLWWLNRPAAASNPAESLPRQEAAEAPVRQTAPEASEDMFWALGLGGQVVQVDPATETVVVRLGPGNPTAQFGSAQTARVVTEALVEP